MKIIDIAHMLTAVEAKQDEQAEKIDEISKESRSRSSASIKVVVGVLGFLAIPLIGALIEGGRLIERIDELSNSVHEIGHDHESRLRVLEKQRP